MQGCKRILISDEFYDRMNDSHFQLDNTAILEINEEPFVNFSTQDHKYLNIT